jgi:colicin import membrane protein
VDDQPTKHRGTVIMSVALHVVIVAALMAGFKLPSRQVFPAAATPIQGVMVDQSVITKELERREQAARAEQQRKQREERQARERVEQQRRDKEAAEQRVAEQRRADQAERERVAKEAKEKADAAKREQERVAQEQREKAQRDREETARKEREAAVARQRAQAESELQAQLAAEAAQNAARASGQEDQYIRLIADKIERNWNRPLSAKPGLDCVVNVVQIPGGDVIDVKVGRCNGDDAVMRSIEDAVRRASPLPPPPSQAVFQRNLIVMFRPDS